MKTRRPEHRVAAFAVPLVLLFLAVNAWEEASHSRRMLGFYQEQTDEGLRLVHVVPGNPAASAGLEAGDLLISLDGVLLEEVEDIDRAKEGFVPGRPVAFAAERDGVRFEGTVLPGITFPFFDFSVLAVTVLSYLLLGPIAVLRRPGYLRARLLLVFTSAVALELALPGLRTAPYFWIIVGSLLNGVQMGAELHLASVVPERQSWLERWPMAVPAFYVAGLLTMGIVALVYALDGLGIALPFDPDAFSIGLQNVTFPLWAFGVLLLLGIQAVRYPEPRGRQQAALVALGVVPWAAFTLLEQIGVVERLISLRWQDVVFNATALCYPLAVFVILLREAAHQERIVLHLTDEIQHLTTIREISPLLGQELHDAFHPKSTHVFYRERHSRDLTLGHSTSIELEQHRIAEDSALMRLLEGYGRPLDFPTDAEGLPPAEDSWLRRLMASLIVPLVGRDQRLVGLLILGPKKSEEPYTPRDRQLLQVLANQIGLLYENIRLQQRVHQSQKIRQEVLTRLAEEEIDLVKECPSCHRCFDASDERCPDDSAELELSTPVERRIGGRYRLDRLVGRGGMGAIFEAEDLHLSRPVAVKILLQSALLASEEALARFQREARLTARLRHPNIVAAYDYGTTHTGSAYLVTELLEGRNLRQHLAADGPVEPGRLARWLAQACDGIEAAHRSHVVHRDLKPANLFIGRDPEGGERISLLDFGIAKALRPTVGESEALTVTGSLLGTFAYMSPEQLGAEEVDERCDLYSLGVIAFEALTGRRPFLGDSPLELLHQMGLVLPKLGGESPESERLEAVLQRCLAVRPEDRPRDISVLRRELIPALQAFAEPEGVAS